MCVDNDSQSATMHAPVAVSGNLVEYAFGLHPLVFSSDQMPRWQRSGDSLTLSLSEPTGVTGVSFGVEWSISMAEGTWQALTDTGSGKQHIFTLPMTGGQRKFARFKVSNL